MIINVKMVLRFNNVVLPLGAPERNPNQKTIRLGATPIVINFTRRTPTFAGLRLYCIYP
jgi:hypothetical protein